MVSPFYVPFLCFRVARFTEKVERGIEAALADINGKLGNRLAGIVLDLRNNPGGKRGRIKGTRRIKGTPG